VQEDLGQNVGSPPAENPEGLWGGSLDPLKKKFSSFTQGLIFPYSFKSINLQSS
jgi:hypothetical protein